MSMLQYLTNWHITDHERDIDIFITSWSWRHWKTGILCLSSCVVSNLFVPLLRRLSVSMMMPYLYESTFLCLSCICACFVSLFYYHTILVSFYLAEKGFLWELCGHILSFHVICFKYVVVLGICNTYVHWVFVSCVFGCDINIREIAPCRDSVLLNY